LGVSAGLHLLAIVLYSVSAPPEVGRVQLAPAAGEASPITGTRVLNVVAVEADVAPFEATPEVPEDPTDPGEPTPLPPETPGEAVSEEEARRRTAAEVLRPQAEDSILLRGVDPELTRLTPAERAQSRIDGTIADWNALQNAERQAAEDALDWTHTDEEGNRWGVSPGKLHLGGVTLPLPLNFRRPPGVDRQADQLEADLREIELQEGRGRVWETWKRRAEEIRKRKDKEREEARRASPPDTISHR